MLRLAELLKTQPLKWSIAWALGVLTALASVALLALSGWFITASALAGLMAAGGALHFDYFRPAAIIRALAIARTAGRYGERLASHDAVLGLLKDLRCRCFAAVARGGKALWSADALQRLSSDIDVLDNFPLRFVLPLLWALLLQAVFLLWLGLLAPALLLWVALPLLVAGVLLPLFAAWQGIALAKRERALAQTRRSALLEPLRLLTSLLLWQRFAAFQSAFLQAEQDYGAWQRQQQAWSSLYQCLQQALLALALLLLLGQGVALLASGGLSVALLLAFGLALLGLNEFLQALTAQFTALGFAIAARERLNDMLSGANPSALPTATAEAASALWVRDLAAKQQGALHGVQGIDFTLTRGKALHIRGRSGSGKSTLLDALAGELTPHSGEMHLLPELNYLAQQVDIFDLSLADNLRLGADFDDEALWAVLEKVALADWARAQPQGLATPLGEYGAAVSGGQARRIALARLLLRPKALLLLDEPFAGLDKATRERLWQTLCHEQAVGFLIVASHHALAGADILDIDKE